MRNSGEGWGAWAFVLVGACAVLALVLAGTAHAGTNLNPLEAIQTGGRSVSVGSGGAIVTGGELHKLLEGRTYPLPGTDGSTRLQDLLKNAPGPAGPISVIATRRALWPAVAKGLARSLPIIGNAITIAELLKDIRCQEGFGGGWECDQGQNQQNLLCWKPLGSPTPPYTCSGSPGGAAAQAATRRNEAGTGDSVSGCQRVNTTWSVQSATQVSPTAFNYTLLGTIVFDNCGTGSGSTTTFSDSGFATTTLMCPEITLPSGEKVVPAVGVDSKCPTQTYTPQTEAQAEEKIKQHGDKSKTNKYVKELDEGAIPYEVEEPGAQDAPVSGPESIPGGTVTETGPDGSVTIRETDWPMRYAPGGYEWDDRTTTKQAPPGGTPVVTGTTVGSGPSGGAPTELKTCGLPNTPPCKIDETGTPAADPLDKTGQDDAKAKFDQELGGLGAKDAPAWTWTFQLPSSCSPIATPAFAPWLTAVDVCPYQPVIHDLMSLAWIAATVFGCVALVNRAQTGG